VEIRYDKDGNLNWVTFNNMSRDSHMTIDLDQVQLRFQICNKQMALTHLFHATFQNYLFLEYKHTNKWINYALREPVGLFLKLKKFFIGDLRNEDWRNK
jgi:hypothetical protein